MMIEDIQYKILDVNIALDSAVAAVMVRHYLYFLSTKTFLKSKFKFGSIIE